MVGKHHAAVKHMDHYPLTCLPKESISPASLEKKEKETQVKIPNRIETYFTFRMKQEPYLQS